MLHYRDILGKQAQSFYREPGSGPSFYDLVAAVRADRGLTPEERDQLLGELRGLLGGSPESTPLSSLMYRGLGGILGGVIGKYFGMSAVGQLMSAAAGFGVGSAMYNRLNRPPTPYPGFRSLG